MKPERMAELVARWVRLYTRNLPTPIARDRIDELAADLHDHITYERARGLGDLRIAFHVASRMIRGLAADLAWRRRHARRPGRPTSQEGPMKTSNPLLRSTVRVALGVALILSLPAVGMLMSDEVDWSLADFVLAGILLAVIGVTLELVARRTGNLALAIGIGVLGVAAALFGEADDAPGLVLLGLVLIASAAALGIRRARAAHGR